jgi:hypothetical protein
MEKNVKEVTYAKTELKKTPIKSAVKNTDPAGTLPIPIKEIPVSPPPAVECVGTRMTNP